MLWNGYELSRRGGIKKRSNLHSVIYEWPLIFKSLLMHPKLCSKGNLLLQLDIILNFKVCECHFILNIMIRYCKVIGFPERTQDSTIVFTIFIGITICVYDEHLIAGWDIQWRAPNGQSRFTTPFDNIIK